MIPPRRSSCTGLACVAVAAALLSSAAVACLGSDTLGAGGEPVARAADGATSGGEVLYVLHCQGCHGDLGQGRFGTDLAPVLGSFDPVAHARATIAEGVRGTTMPAWSDGSGGPLEDAELDDVAAYVVDLVRERQVPVVPAPAGRRVWSDIAALVGLVAVVAIAAGLALSLAMSLRTVAAGVPGRSDRRATSPAPPLALQLARPLAPHLAPPPAPPRSRPLTGERPRRLRWLVLAGVVLAAVTWWLLRSQTGRGGDGASDGIGAGDGCRRSPAFSTELGFAQPALATTLTNVKGLAVVDQSASDPAGSAYQHETWDDAGFLGPFITDRVGNVYVAPTPLVSTQDNPPELQNRVYKVDTVTREMTLLVDLPGAHGPGSGNPFGVVGLAYDCDTESLYATSVAGSTARSELGRIFRIDLGSRSVEVEREAVDALAVTVFVGSSGKRLYYAPARTPEVRSVALDDRGDVVEGEARLEVALGALARGGRDTVRRIRFAEGPQMRLFLMDFTYSLQVAGEREEDELRYTYDRTADAWVPTP